MLPAVDTDHVQHQDLPDLVMPIPALVPVILCHRAMVLEGLEALVEELGGALGVVHLVMVPLHPVVGGCLEVGHLPALDQAVLAMIIGAYLLQGVWAVGLPGRTTTEEEEELLVATGVEEGVKGEVLIARVAFHLVPSPLLEAMGVGNFLMARAMVGLQVTGGTERMQQWNGYC